METWDDGARRLLTLKISLRRLGGQPSVGASAQSVVLTASHSSFIEVPSTLYRSTGVCLLLCFSNNFTAPHHSCNVLYFCLIHTTVLLVFWTLSRTTRVSRYQKGKTRKVKTNLDLQEQEIVSGSGICWAICKSAPHPREPRQNATTQFFTGRMPFLTPNQQRQSTEGLFDIGVQHML